MEGRTGLEQELAACQGPLAVDDIVQPIDVAGVDTQRQAQVVQVAVGAGDLDGRQIQGLAGLCICHVWEEHPDSRVSH